MIIVKVFRPGEGRVREVSATIDNGVWQCDDEKFLEILRITHLPFGYHPDPDKYLAELVVNRYGGSFQDQSVPSTHVPPEDAVY